MLHEQWEVAISEIQFLYIFLHVRHNENISDSSMLNPMRRQMTRLRQKKLHFQMEFTTIHELIEAINITCKDAESHFYFEHQRASLAAKST